MDTIDISAYSYHLPEEAIARYPLKDREQSRLLLYEGGSISHSRFEELPRFLDATSRLIMNDTKVIRARLHFRKSTGARIEIFCLEPEHPADYQQAFAARESCVWKCTVGNLKKWKQGKLVKEFSIDGQTHEISAEMADRKEGEVRVRFAWSHPQRSFGEILEALGEMPIPPYLKRNSEPIDRERYQTVYSRIKGSVAAPTAGLHFTNQVLEELAKKGVCRTQVTLHVGAGTFKPVQEADARAHEMHTESLFVHREAIEALMDETRRNVAVGTTSVRTIESLYWLGVKLLANKEKAPVALEQWESYELPQHITQKKALEALLAYLHREQLEYLEATTRLMIVPGYQFRMTDEMLTNFHLPQSTLLLLVAAFIGEDWRRVYAYALEQEFRFLSYGDSSLLKP